MPLPSLWLFLFCTCFGYSEQTHIRFISSNKQTVFDIASKHWKDKALAQTPTTRIVYVKGGSFFCSNEKCRKWLRHAVWHCRLRRWSGARARASVCVMGLVNKTVCPGWIDKIAWIKTVLTYYTANYSSDRVQTREDLKLRQHKRSHNRNNARIISFTHFNLLRLIYSNEFISAQFIRPFLWSSQDIVQSRHHCAALSICRARMTRRIAQCALHLQKWSSQHWHRLVLPHCRRESPHRVKHRAPLRKCDILALFSVVRQVTTGPIF